MLRFILGAAALVLARPASAHQTPQAGRVPFVVDGAIAGAGSTWGLVLPGADGRWLRACEESFSTAPAWYWRRGDDGTVLISGFQGLSTTNDGGCTYEPVPELLGLSTPSYVEPVPGHLFTTTAQFERENGVFESIDGGKSWARTGLAERDVSFFDLASSTDGRILFASGYGEKTPEPHLRTSIDGGATWTKAPFDLTRYSIFRVLGVDVDDETAVIAVLTDDLQSESRLLHADAEGLSISTAAIFDGEVTHFVIVDGVRFVLVRPGRVFRQGPDDAAFVEVSTTNAPTDCLFATPGDSSLWGCGIQGAPALITRSVDGGATWEPQIPFEAIDYRVCPQGTQGQQACAFYFLDPAPPLGPDQDPDLVPEERADSNIEAVKPAACACATTARHASVGVGAVAGLAGLMLRRRRGRVVASRA
jgi:hypothetical protein